MKKANNESEPKKKPRHDVYCRACHARPSFKNRCTFLCASCSKLWERVRFESQPLENSEVAQFKEELTAFIKDRGRYVWQPEVYMNFRPVSGSVLKKHGITAAKICRDLHRFPPPDDEVTLGFRRRVEAFVLEFMNQNDRIPYVREVIEGANIDHESLWSCVDYDTYVQSLGGAIKLPIDRRFDNAEEFLRAAADVVREAECPLQMTVILEILGMSYPAYLEYFRSMISPEDIHALAGIDRTHEGFASIFEVICEKILIALGWRVDRQVSFLGLVGIAGRPLKIDFGLNGAMTLVEIDGPQHFDQNNAYYKHSIQEHDRRKDEFAKRNGYRLVRVDTRLYGAPHAMTEYLREQIGFGPLNPTETLPSGPARRKMAPGKTHNRPRQPD